MALETWPWNTLASLANDAPAYRPGKGILGVTIYLAGSMRNSAVPEVANKLRAEGYDVFDDWWSSGEKADDNWQAYEKLRGRTFTQALAGYHAQNAYALDLKHLSRADILVLLLPAGKSAHIEMGWMIGKGKRAYILLDGEPNRYDIMYNFATGVFTNLEDLITELRRD